MKQIELAFIILISSFCCFGQLDRTFWFVAPNLTNAHSQSPIKFCLLSYNEAAEVSISQPANPNFTPIHVSLGVNDFRILDLSDRIASIECNPVNTVLNFGFLISSSKRITCYYQIQGFNGEIYSLKGNSALGTNFIVPTQYVYENHNPLVPPARNSIEVVATENNTAVTFSSDYQMDGHPALLPFTIVLQQGQCYSARANSEAAAGHLRNTHITSNRKIAVNSTDDSVEKGGAYDLIGEQIVPIDAVGQLYVAVNAGADMEHIFIFPTQDNTQIFLDNNTTPLAVLDVGEEYDYQFTDQAALITSDKPVIVFQITSFLNELGGTILPQLECTGSNIIKYIACRSSLIITIVTQSQYIDNFSFNNNPNIIVPTDFQPVVPNSNWFYCIKDISEYITVNQPFEISNSDGLFHLGIIEGEDAQELSYGYFSNYDKSSRFHIYSERAAYCEGENIALYADYGFGIDSVVWYKGNNVVAQGDSLAFPSISLNDQGLYYVTGVNRFGCEVINDTFNLIVDTPRTYLLDATICNNEPFYWRDFVITNPGTYYDTLVSEFSGCDSILAVNLHHFPTYIFQEDGAICPDSNYLWRGKTLDIPAIYFDTLNTQDGCDSVFVLDLELLDVSLNMSTNTVNFCNELEMDLSAVTLAPNVYWSTGETGNSIMVYSPGTYTVTADFGSCAFSQSWEVKPCSLDVYIPNSFTPSNEDGINDLFSVHIDERYQVKEFSISIFTRKGERVFHSEDQHFSWNGKYRGKRLFPQILNYLVWVKVSDNQRYFTAGVLYLQ